MRHYYFLALAPLLLVGCTKAASPKPDFANLPAYLTALNRSTDPQAKLIRQKIAAGPADLARERTAAEKEGILTRPSELQQPLPPAGQNAAPIYLQLDALRKQKPLHFPMYAQSLNGRYTYTPEQIAVVQKEYDARQDIFSLLHQAAGKPQCVFVYDGAKPFEFPKEYTGMREDARELNTESTLLAFQGKYTAAAANQELGFRLAANVTSTPKMIGFLVGSAIDAITVSGLQDILAKAGPNTALDSRVSADILALPPLSLRHALSGEPSEADAEFALFRHAKPADLAEALQVSGTQAVPSSVPFTPAEQAQMDLLLDAAQADYLYQMRQIIPAADDPKSRRAVFAAAEARAQANTNDPIRAISDQLNPVVSADRIMGASPTLGGLEQQAARVAARRLVAAAGAAVLAAKAQTGAFPASLPPTFTDPFTSKPLGYRREGTNGFVVYSAGPDGKFDGGKSGYQRILFRYPLVTVPIPQDMLK
jgi:hypothetical protein